MAKADSLSPYADDVLILSAADKKSLRGIKRVIAEYERVSGQLVNVAKSGFLVDDKAPQNWIHKIREITGFVHKDFPITYLGCPFYYFYLGRKLKALFSGLIAKISSRINGWSLFLLSAGGRITLKKSVFMSILIHLLAVLHPPKGVIAEIERIFANFLWGDSDPKHLYGLFS